MVECYDTLAAAGSVSCVYLYAEQDVRIYIDSGFRQRSLPRGALVMDVLRRVVYSSLGATPALVTFACTLPPNLQQPIVMSCAAVL